MLRDQRGIHDDVKLLRRRQGAASDLVVLRVLPATETAIFSSDLPPI